MTARSPAFRWIGTLLLSVPALAPSAPAQDARSELPELAETVVEGLVVTPAPVGLPEEDAPAKVTVITEKEIQETGAENLDQVFRDISEAVIVGDSLYQGVKPQVNLRGVPDQSRTMVMVDGVPLNAAWLGRIEWWMIPVESVERIEVVYGPMSALYGSAAMGGVINVITKPPTEPSVTLLKGNGGSLDSWTTVVTQSEKHGSFGYYFAGRIFETGSYIAEERPRPYNVPRQHDDWSTMLKLEWEPDPTSNLTFNYIHGEEDSCRGREYFNRNDIVNFAYLKYRKLAVNAEHKATLYLNDQPWNRDFDRGPQYNYLDMIEDINSTYAGVMLDSTYLDFWRDDNSLTIGVNYKHGVIAMNDDYQRVTRTAAAGGQQSLVSFFLHDELKLGYGAMVATAGVRIDHCDSCRGFARDTGQAGPPPVPPFSYVYNAKSWTEASPKAALVYHPSEVSTLRFSYGHAFHAPELQQLYTVLARPNRTILGNPDLEPETLDSFELGFNRVFERSRIDVSLYYSTGSDFIGRRRTGPRTYEYDNISSIGISGVEVNLKHQPNRNWLFRASYTFNKSIVEKDDVNPAIEGNDLPLSPQHRATVRATYETPRGLEASAALRHVSKMYADDQNTDPLEGYCTFDLQFAKQLTETLEASLLLRNLCDKRYDVPNLAGEQLVAPGRLIYGTLSGVW